MPNRYTYYRAIITHSVNVILINLNGMGYLGSFLHTFKFLISKMKCFVNNILQMIFEQCTKDPQTNPAVLRKEMETEGGIWVL